MKVTDDQATIRHRVGHVASQYAEIAINQPPAADSLEEAHEKITASFMALVVIGMQVGAALALDYPDALVMLMDECDPGIVETVDSARRHILFGDEQ